MSKDKKPADDNVEETPQDSVDQTEQETPKEEQAPPVVADADAETDGSESLDDLAEQPAQDEAVEDASSQELAEPTAAGPEFKQSGSKLAALALLVSLGAAGGAGYLYYQQWQAAQTPAPEYAAKADVAALKGAVQESENRVSLLSEGIEKKRKLEFEVLAEMDQKIKLQESQIDILENAVTDLNKITGKHLSGWVLGEVAYLVRIADSALSLNNDVPTAIAALQRAEDRLRIEADPNLLGLRQQVAEAKAKLAALSSVDRAEVYQNLSQLIALVPQLPVVAPDYDKLIAQKEQSTPVGATDAEQKGWQDNMKRAWGQMLHGLSKLVRITPATSDQLPFITPDQQQQLYLNLVVQIQNAQTALLQNDQALFKQALATADQWVAVYADGEQETVQKARKLIATASEAPIGVPSLSLKPLMAEVDLAMQGKGEQQ